MITIAMSNFKGGSQKTTSTINLAYALADRGFKVLQIDLDGQASLTILNNEEPESYTGNTMANVLIKELNQKDDVRAHHKKMSEVIINVDHNVDLAPSDLNLILGDVYMQSYNLKEYKLKNLLDEVQHIYDYCIIDCSPAMNTLTTNALAASDYVLIPVSTSYLALRGMQLLVENINSIVEDDVNSDLKILGVVATMYDARTNHAKEVLAELEKDYEVIGTVKKSVKVEDAGLTGKPIVVTEPSHDISQSYISIADKIIAKTINKKVSNK